MKHHLHTLLTLLAVATLAVGFASCSSDDDTPQAGTGSASIIGTWQLVKYEGIFPSGSTYTVSEAEMNGYLFVKFTADGRGGNYEYHFYADDENQWYKTNGEIFAYRLDRTTLTFTYTDREQQSATSSELLSLTDTELKLKDTGSLDMGLASAILTYKRVNDSFLSDIDRKADIIGDDSMDPVI